MLKRFSAFFFALLFCLIAPITSLAAEPQKDPIYDLVLDSQGVFVFNTETDTPMYEKAADARMSPASTTKIMTALVVLEMCADPKSEIITCPDTSMFTYIIEDGGVQMQLVRGEELTAYDVLTGMMLNSYCDAADLLAWHFGGKNLQTFIDKMNEKAAAMGLKNTHFENAHGLHGNNHYSSPRDIALILEAAMENDLFREIISTRSYTIPANSRHKERKLRYTVDIYYERSDYYLPAYVGGKSGFTDQAGRCLATYSEKDGVSYVSVLLGANLDTNRNYNENMAWVETHTLISYLYRNFEMRTVMEKGKRVDSVGIIDSDRRLNVAVGEEIRMLLRQDAEPDYRLELPDEISVEEVADGKEVGKVTILFNGEEAASYPLVLEWDGSPIHVKSALEKGAKSAWDAISGIFREDRVFLILIILLLLVLAICLPAYRIAKSLHRKNSHKPKH